MIQSLFTETINKHIKPGKRVVIVLNDGTMKEYQRVGSLKNGEPTFKRTDSEGNPFGRATSLYAEEIESIMSEITY